MILRFLGTGPAEAIPRPGHRDAACRDARRGGRSRRRRSAVLLTTASGDILFDAGPDITEQLSRRAPSRLCAVFLTHGHRDAVGGLSDLDRWIGANFPGRRIPVYTDAKTRRRLIRTNRSLRHLVIRSFMPFVTVRAGKAAIVPFPVMHAPPAFPTHGFRIGKRFAYASDVSDLPMASAHLVRGIRTFVLDGAMYLGKRMVSHLSADDAIRLAHALGVGRLILTQIGHSYPPHDVADRAIRVYAKTHGFRRPFRVELAFDGLAIRT